MGVVGFYLLERRDTESGNLGGAYQRIVWKVQCHIK